MSDEGDSIGFKGPSIKQRALMSLPLLAFFMAYSVVAMFPYYVIPKLEQFYKEMDLGPLPILTWFVLTIVGTLHDYWFIASIFSILLIAFYFTWCCATSQRRIIAARVLAVGALVVLALGLFAMLLPFQVAFATLN